MANFITYIRADLRDYTSEERAAVAKHEKSIAKLHSEIRKLNTEIYRKTELHKQKYPFAYFCEYLIDSLDMCDDMYICRNAPDSVFLIPYNIPEEVDMVKLGFVDMGTTLVLKSVTNRVYLSEITIDGRDVSCLCFEDQFIYDKRDHGIDYDFIDDNQMRYISKDTEVVKSGTTPITTKYTIYGVPSSPYSCNRIREEINKLH